MGGYGSLLIGSQYPMSFKKIISIGIQLMVDLMITDALMKEDC